MEAVLVEHRFPVPEEFQPKVRAVMAVINRGITHDITHAGFSIQSAALMELITNLYKEITMQIGKSYADYPIWDVSDSGDELIGYRYEFQEEG